MGTIIVRKHPFSGVVSSLHMHVSEGQLMAWCDGMFIQNAMPLLTPTEREFLMTGLNDDDFASMEPAPGAFAQG